MTNHVYNKLTAKVTGLSKVKQKTELVEDQITL